MEFWTPESILVETFDQQILSLRVVRIDRGAADETIGIFFHRFRCSSLESCCVYLEAGFRVSFSL